MRKMKQIACAQPTFAWRDEVGFEMFFVIFGSATCGNNLVLNPKVSKPRNYHD